MKSHYNEATTVTEMLIEAWVHILGLMWEIKARAVKKNHTRPGKLTVCYGKSSFIIGKSTINGW